MDVEKLIEEIIADTRSGEMIEVMHEKSTNTSIEVSDLVVETMKLAQDEGVGVRVIEDNRSGFSYTTDISREGLTEALRQARENAHNTEQDQYVGLPKTSGEYPQVEVSDKAITQIPTEEKIEFSLELEKRARAYDQRIKGVRMASYADGVYEINLANSWGTRGSYAGTYCSASIMAVAEDNGEKQMGTFYRAHRFLEELNIDEVADEAARRAVSILGAKRMPSRRTTLVLDPMVAAEFLEVISSSLCADNVQKGKSFMRGKIGKEVAASQVTIVDDGLYRHGISTAPFDGEGVPSSRTVLIENGQLRGYMYDTYTARRANIESTGNASRSYRSQPEVGTTNFFIEAGDISRDRLIGEVDDGLYVTDVMGIHTANPVSGDYSVGAVGLRIKDGKFAEPVRGVVIAGNIVDFMKSIQAVSDDLSFFGSYGSPTIRVAGITVSGE